MKTYKIAIVGGSISGLSSALVLASAIKNELNFDLTIIDDGKADLFKAEPYNVALFKPGIAPDEIIKECKKQIQSMAKPKYISNTIESIDGTKGAFTLKGQDLCVEADYIILATGANEFNINGLGDIVEPHLLMNRANKIKLKTDHNFKVKDGIYAAGLASGVTSMIASAMGSGASAACALLSDINGAITVVHDSKGTRKK